MKNTTFRHTQFDRIMASATALAAMIGAGLITTSAPHAEAAIVYSGEVNINVPDDFDGLYLNVLDGSFGSTEAGVPGWDINPYSSGVEAFNLWGPATETFLNIGGTFIHQEGIAVDSGGTFTRPGGGADLAPQVTLGSSNNFIGFQFLNENTSEIHFGWARFTFGADVSTRVILDYAYEEMPGAGIQTGAVPEPGSIWLLALGAAGLMARRHRVA